MDRYSRLTRLLEILAERGRVDVDEAVVEFDASPATIRRDLTYLQAQQLVRRTHGGAVASSASYDLPLHFKSGHYAQEKTRIAQAAAAIVSPGSVVSLNGGTTALEVGRAIAVRPELADVDSPDDCLTVVTNAVNIASELLVRPYLKVVLTGGVVRARSFELFGPLASKVISGLSIDIAFVGVNGFDAKFGASAHNDAEAHTNAELVRAARTVVVVADSSKIGVRAFAQICPPRSVDVLVTDGGLSPDAKKAIEAAGIQVTVV